MANNINQVTSQDQGDGVDTGTSTDADNVAINAEIDAGIAVDEAEAAAVNADVAAAEAADGAGDGGDGTVICTEAHRQGYISDEWLKADEEFVQKYGDKTILLGYYSWAKPLVNIMQKSPEMSNLMIPFSIEWAKEMAYIMDYSEEGSEIGKILIEIGMPLSKDLGKILEKDGYSLDNEFKFNEKFVNEKFSRYLSKYTKEELKKPEAKEELRKDLRLLLEEAKYAYLNSQKIFL